jgi:hypothetical protein
MSLEQNIKNINYQWMEMWRRCYGPWAFGLLVNNALLSDNTEIYTYHEPLCLPPLVIIEDSVSTQTEKEDSCSIVL